MKKRIIVTKKQLQEYIERKKSEKIFESILSEMRNNNKFLKENISLNNANQTIIDKYLQQKRITPRVQKLLKEYGIINNDMKII